MLTFLSDNWLWIVFLGGMLLMHRGHGLHGGGHGAAAGGYGAGCGGHHGDDSGAHQGDAGHSQHTEPAAIADDGVGRSLVRPPVS